MTVYRNLPHAHGAAQSSKVFIQTRYTRYFKRFWKILYQFTLKIIRKTFLQLLTFHGNRRNIYTAIFLPAQCLVMYLLIIYNLLTSGPQCACLQHRNIILANYTGIALTTTYLHSESNQQTCYNHEEEYYDSYRHGELQSRVKNLRITITKNNCEPIFFR